MEIQIRRIEAKSIVYPADVIDNARRKIGSMLDGSAPLRGLSFEDEKTYLPRVIGVSPNSPDFDKAARNYWADFTIDVPSDGVVLNIGVRPDGDPVNLVDWIKYQWALKHKLVAENREKATAQRPFYIYNPAVEVTKVNQKVQSKKLAYKELIKLANDPVGMARVIRVLGGKNPDLMTAEIQENFLDQLVEGDPVKFYAVATNKSLETQDEIMQLVQENVLRQVGTQYLYLDTVIGATLEEAILFMTNKRNSQAVAEMKAKLSELTRGRKPINAPKTAVAEEVVAD